MRKINVNTKTMLLVSLLLFTIIVSGIFSIYYFKTTSDVLEASIESSCDYLRENKWELAERELIDFENKWKKTRFVWAIFTEHYEIDNINNCFIRSKYFIESNDYSSALAELEGLKQYVRHIPGKEKFLIENIL